MSKMNLLLLLDHLEEMVNSNFQIAGKVMLDKEEITEIIEKIRISMPEEIREAEWVSQEKERYLEQAQEEAKRILREAESYAERLVNEDQIISRAEEEAKRIVEEAHATATEMQVEAKQFANQILAQLEENLDRTLRIVSKGREDMNAND